MKLEFPSEVVTFSISHAPKMIITLKREITTSLDCYGIKYNIIGQAIELDKDSANKWVHNAFGISGDVFSSKNPQIEAPIAPQVAKKSQTTRK